MTPYGKMLQKHSAEPHHSPSHTYPIQMINANLLPVSVHYNAQGREQAVLSIGKCLGHERSQPLKCLLDLLLGMYSCSMVAGLVTSWSLPRSQICPSCPGVNVPTVKYIHCTFAFSLVMGQTISRYRTKEQESYSTLHQLKKTSPATIQPAEKGEYIFFLQESSSYPYRSPYYSPLGRSCSQQQRPIILKAPTASCAFPSQ